MITATPQLVRVVVAEFEKGGYHLFVNVKLNGKRCRFLIDTGASKTVIDKGYFIKHLGEKNLRVIKQETTGLHSSVPESYFGKVQELQIGKKKIKNYFAAVVDLTHVNMTYAKLKTPRVHGILGSDLLLKYKMIIDYGKLQIIIP